MVRHIAFAVLLFVGSIDATIAAQPSVVTFNDDGGWCWFEDERAIIVDGKLIFGSVAAGCHQPARRGNIEVVSYDLETGANQTSVLHHGFELDDHDSPALTVLSDDRILAMYAKHGRDNRICYRITTRPGDTTEWQSERVIVPSQSSSVTYSNLLRLCNENGGKGRLFDFFRGYDGSFKPSWIVSDDEGETWTARGLWIDFPVARRHRPYVKYSGNGKDTIHFVFTEGHPRDFDNSLYHAFYRAGAFYRSDGSRIKAVTDGALTPSEASKIFAGDGDNVAWPCDLHLDEQQRPVVVYSVQKNSAGLGPKHPEAGRDHRYRWAKWDGDDWQDQELAFGGTRLYAGEDDYTGLICLDPHNTNQVYLSSNVDIQTGEPNSSGRYEIFRGVNDSDNAWTWTAITENSNIDNIRPIVPISDSEDTAVMWLRGTIRTYTDYDLDVVGIVIPTNSSSP